MSKQITLKWGDYSPIPDYVEFCGLNRVRNMQKRLELSDKLSNPTPSHYERVWVVGYLLGIGWTGIEIYNLIACENRWNNYNDNMTYNQIMGIERHHWRTTGKHYERK